MSAPMKASDPAYWMLEEGLNDPSKRSRPTVYREGCYICDDPEFSLMGLPLCAPCYKCGGHVAADDTRCDDCGYDHQDEPREELDAWGQFGQMWLEVGLQLRFDNSPAVSS